MKRKPLLGIDSRIAAMLFLAAGCSSPSAVDQHPSLLRELADRGVTDGTTVKVVVRSSEGNFGADTVLESTDHFFVQGIWDTIHGSRSDPYWEASGFDEIALYTSGDAGEPAATLRLNASGSVHLKGRTPREGFRCPGLVQFINSLLKAEHERKHSASASGRSDEGRSPPASGCNDIFGGKVFPAGP